MIRNSIIVEMKESNQVIFSKDFLHWYNENNKDKVILIWSDHGDIIYLSKQIQDYTGCKVEELIGTKWTSLFQDKDTKHIKNHFSMSTDKYLLSNIVLVDRDQKETPFDLSIDRLLFHGEVAYVCQLKNRTYINELEKMVIDSEKLVLAAQLSAGLVHEIRNPLTSLKGFLQLVQSGVQQKEEYYRVMIGEIDKLEKITTELLQMAKPFKNQMKTENVYELMEDVAFMMNTQTNLKHVELEIACDQELTITCSASQIKQVLINLILNGAEAMTEKGTIKVNSYKLNDYIAIDIIDEGEGITREIVKELHQPFFTTKEKGTGLGLVITQHLLELHHATLMVKPNENKGSTFTILLPIQAEQ